MLGLVVTLRRLRRLLFERRIDVPPITGAKLRHLLEHVDAEQRPQ